MKGFFLRTFPTSKGDPCNRINSPSTNEHELTRIKKRRFDSSHSCSFVSFVDQLFLPHAPPQTQLRREFDSWPDRQSRSRVLFARVPCASTPACPNCPDATPSQFHVTFTGITLCTGCISCDALGVSLQLADGSAIDGTYLLTHNGDCAWTAFSTDVPASATLYLSTDCTGSPTPIEFAIQQERLNASQFRLQITDDSGTILIFDAIVNASDCCAGYMIASSLTSCGCGEDGETIDMGHGGSATVTPC